MATWVVLGCGFIGTRLVRALLADGESVLACARRKDVLEQLGREGASVHRLEATSSRAFPHAMGGLRAPIVVYTIPMQPGLPPGEVVSHATAAAKNAGARRFIYLGSTAVYGEGGDGVAVDEDTATVFSDPDARPFVAAEAAIDNARATGLDAVILRLSPVYGPSRGVRARLEKGSYQLVDDGRHVFSRVHVDDLVGIIRAAALRAPPGATYCVADDRPCTQREHVEWLCAHLDLPIPMSVPAIAPGQPRRRIRNREVSNARLKRELDYTFRYPTYREGELAIDAELGRGADAARAPAETTTAPAESPTAATVGQAASPAPDAKSIEVVTAAALAGGRHRAGHLAVDTRTCAPGETITVEAPGAGRTTIAYALRGVLSAAHPGASDAASARDLAAGDAAVVPPGGLAVTNTGDQPAALLVVTGA